MLPLLHAPFARRQSIQVPAQAVSVALTKRALFKERMEAWRQPSGAATPFPDAAFPRQNVGWPRRHSWLVSRNDGALIRLTNGCAYRFPRRNNRPRQVSIRVRRLLVSPAGSGSGRTRSRGFIRSKFSRAARFKRSSQVGIQFANHQLVNHQRSMFQCSNQAVRLSEATATML